MSGSTVPQLPAASFRARVGRGCLNVIVGFAMFLGIGWALSSCFKAIEQTPKQKVAEEKRKAEEKRNGFHCLSAWNGSHRGLFDSVKNQLREPTSMEHVETRISPVNAQGTHSVLMTYRAQNGFGGMNVERVSAIIVNADCSIRSISR